MIKWIYRKSFIEGNELLFIISSIIILLIIILTVFLVYYELRRQNDAHK